MSLKTKYNNTFKKTKIEKITKIASLTISQAIIKPPIFEYLKILPIIDFPINYNLINLQQSIENLILSIIPKNILVDFEKSISQKDLEKVFDRVSQNLPIIVHSDLNKNPPFCFSLLIFCSADFNMGISRFITEMLNKWLIPGNSIDIEAHRSIRFKFKSYNKRKYFFCEYFINVLSQNEYVLIKSNILNFISELKLILLSVQRASKINAKKELSKGEKTNIIKNDISNFITKESSIAKTFNQMQNFLSKISNEKKITDLTKSLAKLMQKTKKPFDRNIFDSLHSTSLIFKGNFTTIRDTKHLSQIIAEKYFLKKSLLEQINNLTDKQRLVKLKFLKTILKDCQKKVLGILGVMNLLYDSEVIEKNYIIKSILEIFSDYKYVKNSYIVDLREDKIISFYLEVENTKNKNFSLKQINELKKNLIKAFKVKTKKLINPIFYPRNEEEILRNTIVLTKQLNYVKDIPQLIISYDKQTTNKISFLVILLRLIKKNAPPLKDLFNKTFLKFYLDESKIVDTLKNKYPKEANIFRVSLDKFSFLREDHSLDLRQARLTVAKELTEVIGPFRDFNGGLLSKQLEAFDALKKLMPNLKKSKEPILEDFFYSIRPAVMQSILDTQMVKKFYLMFESIFKKTLATSNSKIRIQKAGNYYFVMIKTNTTKLKEDIILALNKLKFTSYELISSSIDQMDKKMLGYILLSNDQNKRKALIATIKQTLIKP